LDDCDVSCYHHHLTRIVRRHNHDEDADVLLKRTLCVHRDSISHSTWTLISHCDAAAVWTCDGLRGDAVEHETTVSSRNNTHLHVPK
jgi:hypothetical protein